MKARAFLFGLLIWCASASVAFAQCSGQAASGYACGNGAASSGFPSFYPLSTLFDRGIGSGQGSILNRFNTGWVATVAPTLGLNGGTGGSIALEGATSGAATISVPAAAGSVLFQLPSSNGTNMDVLTTDGSGHLSWTPVGTAGAVTLVGLAMPGIFAVTGSPVTSTGTLTASLNTQSANMVWAGPPSGLAAAPTFRPLAGADLPAPTTGSLGGVEANAAVSHQWINAINASGVPQLSQPAFSDIGGTVLASQFPALTGDVSTPVGSLVTTLATVNANVGSFGSATAIPYITVDAKGRILAASTVPVNPFGLIASPTNNAIYKGQGASAPIASALTDDGSKVTTSEPVDLTNHALVTEIANAGTTGTTVNKLAKLTGAPATAVITATTDTGGAIGIVLGGAGIAGNALVATQGQANCVFDGGITSGDYVQISSTVAGDCHDAGASFPSVQTVGRVLSATNGSAGTYAIALNTEIKGGSVTSVAIAAGNGLTTSGTCNSTSSVNCTISQNGGPTNVLNNGLVGDGKAVTDAVTNGTTTLTSATANFTSADVGKAIAVRAGGAAGATLVTTISSVTNSTTIVMAAAAGVSSTGLEATYGTDNTSALNTLISGTPTNGATLFFPAGVYCFTGQVTFTAKRITFEGAGYAMSGGGATPLSGASSVLTYLGSGSGNFLYGGAHTNGAIFEGFQFAWASDKWTGNFITFTNDGGADPAYNVVRDSVFAVAFNGSENTGINIDKSLGGKISNVAFYSLAYGIVGGDNSTGYANGYKISGNSFALYTTQAIIGSFEGTQFSGNIFEASATGVGAAYSDYSANPSQGLSWTGNWFGDSSGGTAWIIYYGRGISFSGNAASGPATTDFLDLHGALGFILTGNVFSTFNYVANCVAATCNGGFAQANTYHALTGGFEGGAANMGTSVNITYNVAF